MKSIMGKRMTLWRDKLALRRGRYDSFVTMSVQVRCGDFLSPVMRQSSLVAPGEGIYDN